MKIICLILFLTTFSSTIFGKEDPLLGTWSTMVGGYIWSIIIRSTSVNEEGYTLIGVEGAF